MASADSFIEGVGDEVLLGATAFAVILLPLIIYAIVRWKFRQNQTIHPENQQIVEDARQHIQRQRTAANVDLANGNMVRFRRNDSDTQCPICLSDARFAVETNCGHLFCGQCMVTYWRHGTWLGAVRCPVCRQQVTIMLQCYTEAEQNSAELEDIEEKTLLNSEINHYNRRFSGEPRPALDYIRDLPMLLRHLWNEFFSVGGLMYMFRIRIILCFFAACMYLISPLDIIPEAVFGILGLFDDVFVVLLLTIYISIIYRRFITNRAQNAAQ